MDNKIIELPKEEWKGTPVLIRYQTEEYYDVELSESADAFSVRMVKKKFAAPVTHTPEEYDFPDKLYEDYRPGARAWGIVREENGEKKLMACIETCPEEWSNRLIVTELWVADELHRQGVGTRLMDLAKEQARAEGRRALILETQSCNVRAIAFYRSQGFRLIGFDDCCYSNRDVERCEVRLDFGYTMEPAGDGCRIRPVCKEDLGACVRVIRESFSTVADEFGITPENAPHYTAFAVTEERLMRQLEDEHRPMFVCSVDGGIVGYYSLSRSGDACELNNLAVLPAYRHRGIGGALFDHAVETARSIGCRKMTLGIVEENTRLRAWYEKRGVRHTGTMKYDFFPFTCGNMELEL